MKPCGDHQHTDDAVTTNVCISNLSPLGVRVPRVLKTVLAV